MRIWVPLGLAFVVGLSYAYLYQLTALEPAQASSIGLANLAGLILVFVGVIAAGLIIRRANTP
ncbi:MAG TPA: hypothetical protein VKF39_01215 [Nitrososphaerales archaeon]|nr:hypothetical protein [Nitrososphaerales archaeon]